MIEMLLQSLATLSVLGIVVLAFLCLHRAVPGLDSFLSSSKENRTEEEAMSGEEEK